MLDVADEMGLMIIDETAIRGSGAQDFVAGHDNMVDHARALALRDRNHPAVIRWSQINEPSFSSNDSRAVRTGPVRGDERQRRHPADQHRRRSGRRLGQPVPDHELPQLRHLRALPGRHRHGTARP